MNNDNKFQNNIAENIKKYLKLKNKKRAELADYLDTTIASISRFCLAQSTPTVDQLIKICEFLDISLNDLFGVNDDSKLSDDEIKIIEALRNNPEASKYVKQLLNIK